MIHVASAWQAPDDGEWFSLRIGPETPRSPTDAFVLGLARARARAIVTTGRILRDEPGLVHRDDTAEGVALAIWRRERLGLDEPPQLVVLSRGSDLDLAHPAFAASRAIWVTGHAAAEAATARARLSAVGRSDAQADALGLEVIGRDRPGLLDTIALLHARGLAPVLVEAGPNTASVLYEEEGRVDELLLSICHAPSLAKSVRGARQPGADALARAGLVECSRQSRAEPNGRWTFTRHRRV